MGRATLPWSDKEPVTHRAVTCPQHPREVMGPIFSLLSSDSRLGLPSPLRMAGEVS